jgi:hypothetical protein
MKGIATIEERDLGMEAMMKRIRAEADHVDIGVHADAGEKLVVIAAAHEFGATINHPGGTAYGFLTAEDAAKGRITFLPKGQGVKVLGVTRAHVIHIPMRSFIRSTVDENSEKYQDTGGQLGQQILGDVIDKYQGLALMGQMIESDIKRKITSRISPPLKAATIRRKKSDVPLIDHGYLLNSIRYVVKGAGDDARPISGPG